MGGDVGANNLTDPVGIAIIMQKLVSWLVSYTEAQFKTARRVSEI